LFRVCSCAGGRRDVKTIKHLVAVHLHRLDLPILTIVLDNTYRINSQLLQAQSMGDSNDVLEHLKQVFEMQSFSAPCEIGRCGGPKAS
jgi:hypothetical protein